MKVCFRRIVFVTCTVMLCVSFFNTSHAQESQNKEHDEEQQNPLGAVQVIIPGRLKTEPDLPKTEKDKAIADAKSDVKAHINQTLWFTTGCFFPIFGPFYSQRNLSSIPAARTLGKSPQYVAFYIDAYEIQMKKQRYNWALGGCIVGGITDACLVGMLINWYFF